MMAAYPALAQQSVPSTVDPNRVGGNIEPRTEPNAAPRLIVPEGEQQAAPDNAAAMRFLWRDVRIEGATAIPSNDILREWKHAPGAEVSVEDVFAFANAVTRLYSRKGYALSFAVVPEQRIEDGHVVLRVIEGFVERVNFAGDPLPKGLLRNGPIESIAQQIKESKPLRTAALERYLLLINDVPGVQARATLSPSQDVVGGSILTINITRTRRNMDVGYNSFLPRSLGTHIVGGTVDFNGVLTGADRVRLGAFQSITSDAFWSLSGDYSSMIGADGLTLNVSGGYSHTRPTTPLLRLLDYQGDSTTARVALNYPLIRTRSRNLTIEAGTALANADSQLLGSGEMRDRLRSTMASLNYVETDGHGAVTQLRLGMEKGLSWLDARANSRANGRLDYMLVTMEAQRLQPLLNVAGGQLSALFSAQGQLAAQGPLYSAAECSFGGRRYGRRFDAGVLVGDHCVLSSAELRWNVGGIPVGTQIYGFIDGGRVWQAGALLPREPRSVWAASAGVGLRLSLTDHISGGIEASRIVRTSAARPLEDGDRLVGNIGFRF
ncbi:hemolysin activation/secretion protein [Sphingobium sp. B1D7B]|uniref:ShlB/FhaC/HecB family hemolysin secretion/activation protein n=1 Tax=Sphingobium sp. B1D7B TaxID=2940578 RepID=UPI002224A3F0|nr:ShlB/FhaC/HecB family hemolysin secretion/activation protein [Sphingobium sp. B1D7B]MCW2406954.1 hemolysin activation/secretion protein [Sphingobium sp. B1D7B]